MKRLNTSVGVFGPFNVIAAHTAHHECDGVLYFRNVVGDAVVEIYAGPTQAEQLAMIEAQLPLYDAVVQAHLDQVARDFGYGDPNRPEVSPILHAITYADEPAVPKFQVEGRLLRAWRSLFWAACWPILEAVRNGQREVPAPGDLVEELLFAAPAPTPDDVVAALAAMV